MANEQDLSNYQPLWAHGRCLPSRLASLNGIGLLTWPDLASLRPLNVKYVGGGEVVDLGGLWIKHNRLKWKDLLIGISGDYKGRLEAKVKDLEWRTIKYVGAIESALNGEWYVQSSVKKMNRAVA